ncbi:putative efflux pump antibiotic resistance protein [Aspergillus sclerotiicarbonarius CBS 121057]|uniref:Putative efflux pump antibiotic resistance protein n=1 Tax=Aspergillus sclerotiicarbonarius (strain CBS 121057 / IBT 28362) TaxID=1448318 RepID=A0A319ERW2_ASPSB|nr:putative efflux pump antibiotic resistance protein [Aspergillus sclerotiicarbonarius CBS 121057]
MSECCEGISITDSKVQSDCGQEKSAGLDASNLSLPVPPEADGTRRKKPWSFFLAFLALLLMVFLVSLDATTLAVAIPAITKELSGTTLTAFWASISFTLAVVVVQPIYTSVSDIIGRKLPLYAAFFLFFVGSIVFSVAPSMAVLILGRVLQGLGGGGLDVLSEVIVADITTLQERALYIGLLSIPMAAGSILGPILGALFSEYVDWRWIGWINLPIIAIAVLLAIFFMRLKPVTDSFRTQLARLDWLGIVLFTIGCTVFTLPLSWAGNMYLWRSWQTIVPLVIGVFVLVGFAVYESRPESPVFPYRIFRSRTAQMSLIGSFIHGLVLYTLLMYLPLFFQAVYLESALKSAITMLPFCCVLMGFTGIAAWALEYFRNYRWEIWGGWVFLTVGVGLLSLWNGGTDLAMTASFQAIAGVGIGTLFTVPPIPMQASAPTAEDQGLAIGIMVSFRLFGALIGLAIGSTTFGSVFERSLSSVSLPESLAFLREASEAVSYIPNLRTADLSPLLRDEIRNAYKDAMQTIWYILTAFGGVGFFTSLLIEQLDIETEELGRQHFEHESA